MPGVTEAGSDRFERRDGCRDDFRADAVARKQENGFVHTPNP